MKEGIILSVTKWSRIISMAIVLGVFLAACGDDDNSFAPHDEDSPSSVCEDCDEITSSSSSSSVILSSSEGSSSSCHSGLDPESSNTKGDDGSEAAMTSNSAKSSSSSVTPKSSSSETSVSSSSSSKEQEDGVSLSSSSGQAPSAMTSSSAKSSSSSVTPKSSSSLSSSSEYVPFDHSKTLAEEWRVGENAYKQFTDTRNGRSYYYITIKGIDTTGNSASVTIMAENLNIGEMVSGDKNQNDDDKIERYCYNNDTTYCDEFGGLYQWTEMMQLPSRCNTESCSDLIQENHQGICPDDWRLMTYNDFFIAWHAETNEYGIEGVRSMYGFNGYNSSGLSLVGAGLRTKKGEFSKLNQTIFFAYPQEHVVDSVSYVYSSYISGITDHAPRSDDGDLKIDGYSVRCVMVE